MPLSPKFAKMLIVALKYGLAHYTIMMVACMSVAEIYVESSASTATNTSGQADDPAADGDIDPDLVTSIDIERGKKKQKRLEK